mgnify:CR=1 FL=1
MNIHRRLWYWCRRPIKPASTNFVRLVTPLYVSILIGSLLVATYAAVTLLPPILSLSSSHDETEGWVPKELERISFPGGNIVVLWVRYNPWEKGYISIYTEVHITSENDLLTYVNSRTIALNQLLDSIGQNENIFVTVTFSEPLAQMDFVNLWRNYLEKPLDSAIIVENETSGEQGTLVLGMPSHDEPRFMEYFTNPKGFKLVSVVAFKALVKANVAKTFEQDSRILLVDPQACLTIRWLINKYSLWGFEVTAQMPPFLHTYVTDLPDFTP